MDSFDSIAIKGTLVNTDSLRLEKTEEKSEKKKKKSVAEFAAESDAVVLKASLGVGTTQLEDEAASATLEKSLTLTAQEIVAKINERLKIELPEGVESLKPEDVTPEATAERIVNGSTAFFDIYAKQNSNLSGEELLMSFMNEIRRGIDEGYDDAFKILDGLGAFKFDGVQAGIEKTRTLIDEKLAAYETKEREELRLSAPSSKQTSDAILAEAGASVSTVA